MKNKILKKIILVVVCITVVVSALVLPSFALQLNTNNSLNNPYNNDCVLPVGKLNVSCASHSSDSFNSTVNVPLFNYVGSGSENVATFTDTFPAVNNAFHSFNNAPLYIVNSLPGGFYGLFCRGTVSYTSSSASFDDDFDLIQFNSFSLNNCLLVSSGYNLFTLEFTDLDNDLDPFLMPLRYTITCTYYDENLDKFVDYQKTFETSSTYDNKWVYYFNFIPNEILQSNSRVYIRDLSVTTNLANANNDPLSMRGFSYSVKISVPTKSTYDNYFNTIVDAGYNTGYNTGFDAGYLEGYDSANVSPFGTIMNSVSSFVDWEFIPGVSIGIILTIFVGVVLIIVFLKFFAGG